MKTVYFTLLSTLFFLNGYSQNSQKANVSVDFRTSTFAGDLRTSGLWVPNTPTDSNIKGSVYLFPNFIGQYKIIGKNGSSFDFLNLNYNIKTKTLEAFVSKDSVFQYDLNKINYVLHNNKKYTVKSEGNLKGLSLDIYNSKKIQFFKYFSLLIEKPVINPMTNAVISEAEYEHVFLYYLYINGKEFKIKLNKRDLLDVLSDKEKVVKEYVNSNDLDYTNVDDICKILKYYESI